MICIIDEDELKSVVSPSDGDLKKQRELAVELAVSLAKINTPDYRGKIDLINRTRSSRANEMIVISFRRAK